MLAVFRSRRMAVLFGLGFASGLPYLLTGETLKAWLTAIHVDYGRIASISLVGLAYTFKFAWAPLLDRFELPVLGRRRGWVLAFQLALVVAIAALGWVDPLASPGALAGLAVVVAVLSASQDVVLDAYATDVLAPHERAAGSALYVLGYKLAMLVTGTAALVMADHLPWRVIYGAMAALMALGIVATLLAEEPPAEPRAPRTLGSALVLPFVELHRRLGARGLALVLGFAALYEFGYFFGQSLMITFLKDGAGFELTEIGTIRKVLTLAGIAIGGITAGALVARFGVRRMLVAFGALAGLTHLLYAWLAVAGHDVPVLCVAVLFDSVANAMATSVFVAVLMGACSPAVSATQYALLTSLSSVGLHVFGPFAANVVAAAGWSGFFIVTAATAIPGLVLAWWVARELR